MPYEVKKSDQCPDSKPWACVKSTDGKVMGCHETKGAAEDQMAALMASEKSAILTEQRKRAAESRAERYDVLKHHVGRSLRLQERAPSGTSRLEGVDFPATQCRASLVNRGGEDRYHLVGEATVFDKPYEMWDMFGPYDEIVESGAATETLASGPDVAFLVNHRGLTMARTTNGSLDLAASEAAMGVNAYTNPKRDDVQRLVMAIEDKDVTEMSFAFMITEGWWSDDFMTFKIAKFDINRGDVSAVNYGANPYTSIAARAKRLFSDLDRLPSAAAVEALRRLAQRQDVRTGINDLEAFIEAARKDTPQKTEPAPARQEEAKGGSLRQWEAQLTLLES